MKNQKFQKMRPLSEEELLLVEGGGLSELTHGLVRAAGYIMGRIAGHRTDYSGSALLGPYSRPIM